MNKCIVMGKILEDIKFEFLYNSQYISISSCNFSLLNNSIVKIYGLDDMADYMYQNLEKGDNIIIYGKLRAENNNVQINVKQIEKIK